jgi:hypothetical protein
MVGHHSWCSDEASTVNGQPSFFAAKKACGWLTVGTLPLIRLLKTGFSAVEHPGCADDAELVETSMKFAFLS